jgi:hypothetical protein
MSLALKSGEPKGTFCLFGIPLDRRHGRRLLFRPRLTAQVPTRASALLAAPWPPLQIVRHLSRLLQQSREPGLLEMPVAGQGFGDTLLLHHDE